MTYEQIKHLVDWQEKRVNFRVNQGMLTDEDKAILTLLRQKEFDLRPKPVNIPFGEFWKLYDKKIGLPKCQVLWHKMTDKDREEAIQHIIGYVKATPDKKFRKHPETYLRNKCWNDEVIMPVQVIPNHNPKEQKWL